MATPLPSNLDDYSPSATIVPYDRPIPLLRGPAKAGPADDPESGPFVLAFKDPHSWALAYEVCESNIIQQCEGGARIGCSLTASNNCKPPWWKTLLGIAKQDYKERAECEEREMEACFRKAKEKCGELAEQKCLAAFRDSRIAVNGLDLIPNRMEVSKLISWVCLESKGRVTVDIWKLGNSWVFFLWLALISFKELDFNTRTHHTYPEDYDPASREFILPEILQKLDITFSYSRKS